jgi:putative spermidine/putrescine transport system substrate-binding protein
MRLCVMIGGLAAVLVGAGATARAEKLRVALPDWPAFAQALNRAVVRPYQAATHQPVQVMTLPQPPTATAWDVALLAPLPLADACAAGTVAKLDWSQFGGRAGFLPQASSDCGIGAVIRGMVLTWDSARVPGTPNWDDFWNVARLPGRRGLRQSPMGTLEIALLADGVAPDAVYATLSTQDGVERAFRKLDQLRPYIVWWRKDTEPMAIVASGGAVMSSAPSDQVVAASRRLHRGFGVQWSGAVACVQSWAIRAGSHRAAQAIALVNAAEDPRASAPMLAGTGLGGTHPVDAHTLSAADAAASPTAHLAQALPCDAGFWHTHEAALSRRFDAWLKH